MDAVEAAGEGIVQTQMDCGQGRREVWQLAQTWKELGGKARTEWNSVWHSAGHLQCGRQWWCCSLYDPQKEPYKNASQLNTPHRHTHLEMWGVSGSAEPHEGNKEWAGKSCRSGINKPYT